MTVNHSPNCRVMGGLARDLKYRDRKIQLGKSDPQNPKWSSLVHSGIMVMKLGRWLWVFYKIVTQCLMSVDKFLKRKIAFLHLHSTHIRSSNILNYENINGVKGFSFVDCVMFLRVPWHWCIDQHELCEIKWILLRLNDFPLGRDLVQQSHCQMVFMGYLCKW